MINFKQRVLTNNEPLYLYEEFNPNQSQTPLSINLLEELNNIEMEYHSILENHLYAIHYGLAEESYELLEEGLRDILQSTTHFLIKKVQSFSKTTSKMLAYLSSYLLDFNNFLKKNESSLKKLKPEFNLEGYKYTIDDSTPNVSVVSDEFNKYILNINDISKLSIKDIKSRDREFSSEKNLDKLRGKILNTSPITSFEYNDAVRKIFRNGKIHMSTIYIDKERYYEAVSTSHSKLVRSYKDTVKMKKHVESVLNSMVSFFQTNTGYAHIYDNKNIRAHNIQKPDIDNISPDIKKPYDNFDLEALNGYYSFKVFQANTLSSLIILAAVKKIEALEEQVKFERTIIETGLYWAQENNGLNEKME